MSQSNFNPRFSPAPLLFSHSHALTLSLTPSKETVTTRFIDRSSAHFLGAVSPVTSKSVTQPGAPLSVLGLSAGAGNGMKLLRVGRQVGILHLWVSPSRNGVAGM